MEDSIFKALLQADKKNNYQLEIHLVQDELMADIKEIAANYPTGDKFYSHCIIFDLCHNMILNGENEDAFNWKKLFAQAIIELDIIEKESN